MAISAFDHQRAARAFHAFDSDGDGFIEKGDFDLIAARLGEAFGQEPGSPAMQRLARAHSGMWQLVAVADTDHDGRVSLAEFEQRQGILTNPAAAMQVFTSLYDAVVQIADGDGDGKLDEDEYVRVIACRMGVPEDQARVAFGRLDSDGDHLITAADIVDAIRGYHFNDDPSSSASWLLGSSEPA